MLSRSLSKSFFTFLLALLSIVVIAQVPISNKPDASKVMVENLFVPIKYWPTYTDQIKTNYIRTRVGMAPISTLQDIELANYKHVTQSTEYMDGLGRPLQKVVKQATGGITPHDLVTPMIYDQFGREEYTVMPFIQTRGEKFDDGNFKVDPFTEQDYFYRNVYRDKNDNLMLNGESSFYQKNDIEPSPFNRVLKYMAPGASWVGAGKGTELSFLLNTVEDSVHIWEGANEEFGYISLTSSANNTFSASEIYGAGQLYKSITKDEDGASVIEYKDKEGNIVLRQVEANDFKGSVGGKLWLSTYYVFDDLNRLRLVIPPKAVATIQETSWTLIGNDVIEELCFRYEYDSRNRLIAKHIPGAGWNHLLYDGRDRQVFMQDANMRLKSQWMTTLYDNLNREVATGVLTFDGSSMDFKNQIPGQGSDGYLNVSDGTFIAGFVPSESLIESGNSSHNTIPFSLNPLPPGAPFVPLTITFFDDYLRISSSEFRYTDAYNGKLDIQEDSSNSLFPEPMLSDIEQSGVNTKGLVTASMVRVLEDPGDLSSGKWLTTVLYYDSKGRVIETRSENYKGGIDMSLSQYDFTGKEIGNYLVQNNPQSSPSMVIVKTIMKYDHNGRLFETWKTINDEDAKQTRIAKNEYDEFGQLIRKELGQKRVGTAYSSSPVETLDYNYNIRGWLKGINAAYSHPELVRNTSVPDRWFGMELNYDWGSETGKNILNGNISSTTWRSKGDDIKRAFGYTYDKANRLLGGDFSENLNGGYLDNPDVDFDMIMTDGTAKNSGSAYDENGNIKGMVQNGLKLGKPALIDNLSYQYFPNTNKLKAVEDSAASTVANKLGDFVNKNADTDDYGYDVNGNLVTDKNKSIGQSTGAEVTSGTGIIYNHLNLPWQVPVIDDGSATLKGAITYVYDATGNKLEKRVREEASAGEPLKESATTYIGGMVYENNVLQFISHEEGRTRINTTGTEAMYNYDYYVRDHLGNVRMVLTDETSVPDVFMATIEDSRRPLERDEFGQLVETLQTLKNEHPGFDTDTSNKKIIKLDGNVTGTRVGPGIVLKVMSGDKVKAGTFSWYRGAVDNSSQTGLATLASSILSNLIPGIGAAGKLDASTFAGNAGLEAEIASFLTNNEPPVSGTPKAYLNWILFDDEQFKKVNNSSGARQIPEVGADEEKKPLFAGENNGYIDITRNGYIYVYVSNESNTSVYFDDLRIEHLKGPLLEETHYYPFGLTMYGISSRRKIATSNHLGFNGKSLEHNEFNDESGLDLYDYGARMYDAQIGRWNGIDPLAEKFNKHTPFEYVHNNPVNGIDPDGKDVIFINDSKAANGFGHGAVIIGNSKDGWYYYSLNGTGDGQRAFADSKDPDLGTPLGHSNNPKELLSIASVINPKETHDYTKFVMLKTTPTEDKLMKAKALQAASVKKYIVIGQSCIDVQKGAYDALTTSRMGLIHNYMDIQQRGDAAPNSWIQNLPRTLNNLNTFSFRWGNGNYFDSPGKLKPVIIVHPLEDVTPKLNNY